MNDKLKSDSGAIKAQNRQNQVWSQHPLVSALLWILGTEIETTPNAQLYREDSKANIVSWRDDQGGNIAEYMSRIQVQRGIDDEKREVVFHVNQSSSIKNNNGILVSSNDRKPNNNEDTDCSPSPQWGFYIPITPPQETYYSKNNSAVKTTAN